MKSVETLPNNRAPRIGQESKITRPIHNENKRSILQSHLQIANSFLRKTLNQEIISYLGTD